MGHRQQWNGPEWEGDEAQPERAPSRKRRHKRLKTAYELFLAEFKKRWRRDHPGVPFEEAEARKHGRDEWASIGEAGQKPYEDQAKHLNKKNLEERAIFKAQEEQQAASGMAKPPKVHIRWLSCVSTHSFMQQATAAPTEPDHIFVNASLMDTEATPAESSTRFDGTSQMLKNLGASLNLMQPNTHPEQKPELEQDLASDL